MRKSNIQQLTLAAMVAAVYFVLCYFGNIFQLTFGPIAFSSKRKVPSDTLPDEPFSNL